MRTVQYTPGRDDALVMRYYKDYVNPLGKDRIRFEGNLTDGLVLKSNSAGFMHLLQIAVQVASEPQGGHELYPPEFYNDELVAETEPGSSFAGIFLDDWKQDFTPIEYFEYTVADQLVARGTPTLEWNSGAWIKVSTSGSKKYPMYDLSGNQRGLLSLATHFATLAQPEVGADTVVQYKRGIELAKDSLPLIVKKISP